MQNIVKKIVSVPIPVMVVVMLCVGMLLHSQASGSQVHQSNENNFRLETILPDLSNPWSLALVESGVPGSSPREAFVTLRSGTLYYISDLPLPGAGGSGTRRSVRGLPDIYAIGQGGLLDVILAENFRDSSRIYFSASIADTASRAGTAVFTARFNKANMWLENVEKIFSLKKTSLQGVHFGSRLALGPDGDLFVSVGERGDPPRAQDRSDAAGSIIRIPLNAEGLSDGSPENYSYGHRNIQGLLYHEAAGRLLAHEHGPRGGDEINMIFPNANYGWPRVSYGVNYSGSKVSDFQSLPGITEPLVYWVPSIAPSGFALYPETGVFAPEAGKGWSGQLFVGALAGRHLHRVKLPSNWQQESLWPLNNRVEEENLLHNAVSRIRDVRVDAQGYIYILNDERFGGLYRLIPADQ